MPPCSVPQRLPVAALRTSPARTQSDGSHLAIVITGAGHSTIRGCVVADALVPHRRPAGVSLWNLITPHDLAAAAQRHSRTASPGILEARWKASSILGSVRLITQGAAGHPPLSARRVGPSELRHETEKGQARLEILEQEQSQVCKVSTTLETTMLVILAIGCYRPYQISRWTCGPQC